jgi:hypothetical protein
MIAFSTKAQEVQLGLTIGTTPYKRVVLDWAQFAPENGYYTYVEENTGEGIISANKVFNSVNIGAVINFSYRKFGVNIEPQYGYERTVYKFAKPNTLSRVIGAKSFRFPFYFTYKFFKKENSSYFLLGFNFINETNWDFQHPGEKYYLSDGTAYFWNPDFGDDHFQGVLYDGKTYTNFIIGLGKQFKRINASLRFQSPMGKVTERLPVSMFRTEFTLNWMFLSTKDFTRKHPLYVD